MSLISSIYGTDDDIEILTALYTIANVSHPPRAGTILNVFMIHSTTTYTQNTAGLGLIHESQSIYSTTSYTRPWFAWANSYFAEMMLDLAQRKPGLIFTNDEPYTP